MLFISFATAVAPERPSPNVSDAAGQDFAVMHYSAASLPASRSSGRADLILDACRSEAKRDVADAR
jgi:hypothetical protein